MIKKKNKSLLVRRAMIPENDRQLQGFIDNLIKNKKAIELVKLMKPLDIAGVIATDFELCPKAAAKTTVNLIKHIHDIHYEGISGANIETNKQYPVPPPMKKDTSKLDDDELGELGELEDLEETSLARPQGKTVWGRPGPDSIPRHHFPPDPRGEVEDWPYDDMTQKSMEPSTKSRKRPLMMSKDKKATVYKFKGMLDPDLRTNQPGGDGAGSSGIYQKSIHSKDNSMSTAGTRTWNKRGRPGWSSSPPGEEFENPDADNNQPIDKEKPPIEAMGGSSTNVNPKSPNAGDEDESIPSFMKDPPVGSSIPTSDFGGRTPVTNRGRRAYRRK